MWGYLAKVNILEHKRKKIGHKKIDVIFVGSSFDSNTYRFLIVNSNLFKISNDITIESRYASFF